MIFDFENFVDFEKEEEEKSLIVDLEKKEEKSLIVDFEKFVDSEKN